MTQADLYRKHAAQCREEFRQNNRAKDKSSVGKAFGGMAAVG